MSELIKCKCGGTPDAFVAQLQYAVCQTCHTKADLDMWNRIMDTTQEDQLREQLVQKMQQLEELKQQCKSVIAGCEMLNEFDYFVNQQAIDELKGML